MTELPKTEAELQALLDAKATEVTESLTAEHNGKMATLRKKYEDDIKKAKEQANLTAEQIAEQKVKEQQEHDLQELNELRQFKKVSVISEKLNKEGLPDFFKNDSRLLNAEDGDLDKVIKDIKKDYEPYQQKGAKYSTVVQNASGQKPNNDKAEVYQAVGEALKDALGK